MKILYCSTPCGSGKTHNAVSYAAEMAADGKIAMILQPTTDLIDKTIADEIGGLVPKPMYTRFHGKASDSKKGVGLRLSEHLKNFGSEGQVLFATHQVLEHVEYWPTKKDVHIIIDETFQVHDHQVHSLPKSHRILTDHFKMEHHNAVYSRIVRCNRP
ncbi:MAG: hypothetical protein H7312_16475, partial [Tardiphaga sp.]|nr:hypothetical protein [Tardiphaga sp.]